MKKEKLIFIAICAVAVLGAVYLIYEIFSKKEEAKIVGNDSDKKTIDIDLSRDNLPEGVDFEVIDKNEGGKINQSATSSVSKVPIPNLYRPISFKDSVPPQIKVEMSGKIKDLSEDLKKDNDYFMGWIQLGLYRKSIEDYEGAKQAWEYAGAIRPKNSVSFGNLGVLYGFYLKDYPKAEENFLRAIDNDHTMLYLYAQLHEFYRDVLKDQNKANQIAERAIKENPEAKDAFANLLKNY